MNVELITIGDELLDGRVVNTNIQTITKQLFNVGLSCQAAYTISDHPDQIISVLKDRIGQVDLLILTGGLGPTEDDRTSVSVANACGLELERRKDIESKIKAYFESKGRPCSTTNLKQADFPESAQVIENKLGTAPAYILTHAGTIIVVLPGVPKEMLPILRHDVMPLLQSHFQLSGSAFETLSYTCFGLGESVIAEKLSDIYPLPDSVALCFRVKYPEVQLLLKGPGLSQYKAELDSFITETLGSAIVAKGALSFLDVLAKKLRDHAYTIATAESCTGGLLSKLLTDLPGASDYFRYSIVPYSNESKQTLLSVPESIIETYGAVSEETAKAMLEGLMQLSQTDIGIAITGVAGPGGGSLEKPIGTVYIAVSICGKVNVYEHLFLGDRDQVRLKSAYYALFYVLN